MLKFAGALLGKAGKGVFLTTSNFSDKARLYTQSNSHPKIILIDWKQLCELMWER
ncbi:MAG: restriction endonuclease [Chlamydiales bacterium]